VSYLYKYSPLTRVLDRRSSADNDLAPHNVFKFFDDDKEGENENEAVADYTSRQEDH